MLVEDDLCNGHWRSDDTLHDMKDWLLLMLLCQPRGVSESSPLQRAQEDLRTTLKELLDRLGGDARALGCQHWLDVLRTSLFTGTTGSDWLRARSATHKNLNDVVRDSAERFAAMRPLGN